jgi:hypothetical protein
MAALSAAVASCLATACGAGQGAAGAGASRDVSVTCTDGAADAVRLQHAIDSSSPGDSISITGGTCLLTRGITLLGGRTYTGGSTTGTVLRQDGRMRYVLASAS